MLSLEIYSNHLIIAERLHARQDSKKPKNNNKSSSLPPKVSKASPPCEIYLENDPEDCKVHQHLENLWKGSFSEQHRQFLQNDNLISQVRTSGKAKAIHDPKLRECSGNCAVRKPTRMRFGGVPGQFLFAKESEEHDCDTDIGQKRKILIVEMGEIVDDTYDGSSASNVGRVGHGQIHHSLLLPANHDVRSLSCIELKEAIVQPV